MRIRPTYVCSLQSSNPSLFNLPVQDSPFPVNPGLHVQVKEPMVF